jgi:hypothetical protein
MSIRRHFPVWLLPLALVVVALSVMAVARGGPTIVNVFPVPGARVATPQTQLTFRGIPAASLGKITVTGSHSGRHGGRVLADSDGDGGSFVPARPFTAGEVVTVRTSLEIQGGSRGAYRFTVATPAGAIPIVPNVPSPRTAGDVLQFHSRPDLTPAAVEVSKSTARDGPGDIFLGPQTGPLQNGPMIVDSQGNLVWFKALPDGEHADDFRVQKFAGRRVLTWWQGREGAGIGFGQDVITDSAYRQIRVVRAGNGLQADLHEFQLTPQGTALITAYYPVYWNATLVRGSAREIVLDAVVQEVDVRTGLVLFQWDSLDHVSLAQTHEPLPGTGQPFDYFHVNAVQQGPDGNLVVSARNTWAAYDVDHNSGRVIWTLGGNQSSFKMGPGTSFAFQHDVRVHPGDDQIVTAFDDGAGPPTVHAQSRAVVLRLNPARKTVKLVRQDEHSPALLADFEGNTQTLKDGDRFVGWGEQPYFTEFDSKGQIVFDGRFIDTNTSYRVYRLPWSGTPTTPPAITASSSGSNTTVYASWNGATNVASWKVLGGKSASSLSVVRTVSKQGFETQIAVTGEPYVAVEAMAANGKVLGTSKTIASGATSA